jgi:hypothetical protein
MMNLSGAALVAATIAMGLASGLFYTFACSVMIGLGQTGDRSGLGSHVRLPHLGARPARTRHRGVTLISHRRHGLTPRYRFRRSR